MTNNKGLIPSEIIDEIKLKLKIVEYISSKQELKERGKNFCGKCPVCGKPESFVVYPETTSFYCFSCSIGGDIISYVMKTQSVDYKSAVAKLASIAKISIQNTETSPMSIPRQTEHPDRPS